MSDVYAVDEVGQAVARIGLHGLQNATSGFRDYWDANDLQNSASLLTTAEDSYEYDIESVSAGSDEYIRAVRQMIEDDYRVVAVDSVDVIRTKYDEQSVDEKKVACNISKEGEWVPYEGPQGGEGWRSTETGRVEYQERPPGELDADVLTDEQIATIQAETTASDSDTGLDVEGVKEVFGNIHGGVFGQGESNDYRNEDHAAARLVIEGRADSETVAQALIEENHGIKEDEMTLDGRSSVELIGNFMGGKSKWGINLSYITSTNEYVTGQAKDEFRDEIAWDPHIDNIVEEGINEWQKGMFTEETAPMFQLAADIMGNDTLPEGGAYGDVDNIPDVLEQPVTYEEKEAFEAKMEQTQEILRDAFGDTMTVYRGINSVPGNPTHADNSDASDEILEAKESGEGIVHEHRPIESWTTNPAYSALYATGDAQGNRNRGVMLEKEVPVESVMAASHTGRLHQREAEVIVMHDEEEQYTPEQIIDGDEITDKSLIEEILSIAEEERDTFKSDVEFNTRITADSFDPTWLHQEPPTEEDEPVKKDWVPYQGPKGGEGWRDLDDPNDVRYGIDQPPGNVPSPDELTETQLQQIANTESVAVSDVKEVLAEMSQRQELEIGVDTPIEDELFYGQNIELDDGNEGEVMEVDEDEKTVVVSLKDEIYREEYEFAEIESLGTDSGVSVSQLREISTQERLANAFGMADEREGFREAGFTGGNTTGDQMDILRYADGTKDFAIPVDAYPGTTGVVSSQEEAVRNNTYSPQVIEAFGGNAAQTDIVTDDNGEKYIVKEGIEGKVARDVNLFGITDEDRRDKLRESAAKTAAAAYFTGNSDLHTGNYMVSDDDEVVIIDFDSGGYISRDPFSSGGDLPDITQYERLKFAKGQAVREQIYEQAKEAWGNQDEKIPVPTFEDEYRPYVEDAIKKALRAAHLDSTYDLSEDYLPFDLQVPPVGYDEIEDFDIGEEVEFVHGNGDVREGEIADIVEENGEKKLYVEMGRFGMGPMIEDVNRIVEVK